jgi:outer membrane protein, heavy metal efflux system
MRAQLFYRIRRARFRPLCALVLTLFAIVQLQGESALTWPELRQRFEQRNPVLKAARANVQEMRAEEITANLRPNPDLTLLADGTQITPSNGVWQPLAGTLYQGSLSYLHERQHKRELRFQSAREETAIAESNYADQERSLLFSLRSAFVQVLQAKAVLQNARDNLRYWDHELSINNDRFQAGDMSEVDLNRLQLQRAQFLSDVENALVSFRTSKIQLLQLLNDHTPLDQFDVAGTFDFNPDLKPLPDLHNLALAARPDLQAARQTVVQAKTNYQLAVANGSVDPTFSGWWTHNGSFNNPAAFNTVGLSVTIPLRIFDRNQGEKARTQVDIGRSEQLQDATSSGVFSDVDSAYWALVQSLDLLQPYKTTYLKLAGDVRDKMTFSFRNGGASLLDLLDAEKSYRDTRLAYLNLIGSYLVAAAQMNMAVGQEIL